METRRGIVKQGDVDHPNACCRDRGGRGNLRTGAARAVVAVDVIPSVTASLSDVRLSTALRDLGRDAGVRITLAPEVEDVTIRELMFVKVPFQDAFVKVVHGACLDYAITGP